MSDRSRQPGIASSPEPQGHRGEAARTLTPEIVAELADRVYARLLAELRLERERQGRPAGGPWKARGGRPW